MNDGYKATKGPNIIVKYLDSRHTFIARNMKTAKTMFYELDSKYMKRLVAKQAPAVTDNGKLKLKAFAWQNILYILII